MKRLACSHLAIALALCAAPVAAQQNLLANPGFDGDLTGWDDLYAANSSFAYSSEDPAGEPGSGSVAITVSAFTHGGFMRVVGQCIPIEPEVYYEFWGQAAIPGGQVPVGGAMIFVLEFAATTCIGDSLANHWTDELTVLDSWEVFPVVHFLSAAGAHAVQFAVTLKSDGGSGADPLTALFDNLYFAVAPIFADGFEDGTTPWSETVGLSG